MTPTDSQAAAIKAIVAWYKGGARTPQVFYLAGFAGVGKSEIFRLALAELKAHARLEKHALATFTGKAASVLRRKGNEEAQTIHSLIYIPEGEVEEAEVPADAPLFSSDARRRAGRNMADLRFQLNIMGPASEVDLIALDECFVRGTMVDTDMGPVPIERIRPGDRILNAHGVDHVVACSRKVADAVVRISSGEATFEASCSHPFLTRRGFVRAADLRAGDELIRTVEAVRLLRDGLHAITEGDVLSVLHEALLDAMVADVPGVQGARLHARARSQERRGEGGVLRERLSGGGAPTRTNPRPETLARSGRSGEDQRTFEGARSQATDAGRKRTATAGTSAPDCGSTRPGMDHGICDQHGLGSATTLQARCGASRSENCDRGGRAITCAEGGPGKRYPEGRLPTGLRVDGVTLLQPGDSSLDRIRDGDGNVYLYDLQAARHSSFSVGGVLVHNCSMVDEDMAADVLSFGKKVLVMGDPGQLPPVRGEGYFQKLEPDVFLTEVHRQALESPILRLATLAREGKPIPFGDYGDARVLKLTMKTQHEAFRENTQLLCGVHRVRKHVTRQIRHIRGFGGTQPMGGEPIICGKNNRERQLFNGLQGVLLRAPEPYRRKAGDDEAYSQLVELDVRMDDHRSDLVGLLTDPWMFAAHFGDIEQPRMKKNIEWFDFAYALTVHRAQGSEWPDVTVVDDSGSFKEDRHRWSYTALTRASERLTILRR